MDPISRFEAPEIPTSTSNRSNYVIIFLIVLILAMLGFNIFTNLGYVTDKFADFIEPVSGFLMKLFGESSKSIIKTSTAGTRELTDIVDDTVDAVDDTVSGDANFSDNVGQDMNPNDSKNQNDLISNIENKRREDSHYKNEPKPDESNSFVQQGSVGKKGFCYVGNWNGYRSCVRVTEANQCGSGEIYDSEAICRNPELRE